MSDFPIFSKNVFYEGEENSEDEEDAKMEEDTEQSDESGHVSPSLVSHLKAGTVLRNAGYLRNKRIILDPDRQSLFFYSWHNGKVCVCKFMLNQRELRFVKLIISRSFLIFIELFFFFFGYLYRAELDILKYHLNLLDPLERKYFPEFREVILFRVFNQPILV